LSLDRPPDVAPVATESTRGGDVAPLASVAAGGLARVAQALKRAPPGARRGAAVAAVVLLAWVGTGYDYEPLKSPAAADPIPSASRAPDREIGRLERERARLWAFLRLRVPRGPWIVIDQTHNRLRLMRGNELVFEAPCSAGTGMVLKEGKGGRVWVFDTPRGHFRVLSKLENPVWKKPDWAYLEDGEPIPRNPADRFEYGSLGEYALYFGDGYMIHGTLYERLLGRPASHGCIRLGRDPLRELFRQAPVGTPIYVF
jgi:L,D-transpeptidase ErfK/SrfK